MSMQTCLNDAQTELTAALEEVKSSLPEMLEKIKTRIEHELEIVQMLERSELDQPLTIYEQEYDYECQKEWIAEASEALSDTSSNLPWIVATANFSLYYRVVQAVKQLNGLYSYDELEPAINKAFADIA